MKLTDNHVELIRMYNLTFHDTNEKTKNDTFLLMKMPQGIKDRAEFIIEYAFNNFDVNPTEEDTDIYFNDGNDNVSVSEIPLLSFILESTNDNLLPLRVFQKIIFKEGDLSLTELPDMTRKMRYVYMDLLTASAEKTRAET